MNSKQTYIWFDLGFTAETFIARDAVRFLVFKMASREGNKPLYFYNSDNEAIPCLAGEMSWDGCLQFERNEDFTQEHFCNLVDLRTFNVMTVRLYNVVNTQRQQAFV